MAGTTGLEPAASAVTVPEPMLQIVTRSKTKLHGHSSLLPFALFDDWHGEVRDFIHLQGLALQGYDTILVTTCSYLCL